MKGQKGASPESNAPPYFAARTEPPGSDRTTISNPVEGRHVVPANLNLTRRAFEIGDDVLTSAHFTNWVSEAHLPINVELALKFLMLTAALWLLIRTVLWIRDILTAVWRALRWIALKAVALCSRPKG